MFFWLLFSNMVFAETQNLPVTDYVAKLDQLNYFLMFCSLVSCVLITFAFLYFGYRYRRKSVQERGHATTFHSNLLEFSWSFVPFVIFMVAFAWGWYLYHDVKKAPADSIEIHTYGQKWSWSFVYKNGRKTTNEFYVPVGKSIKLIMTSKDVVHSLFIPAFRIKQDVVPGIYTSLWFKANRKGSFNIFCTEFCGTGHSDMLAKVHVVDLKEWEKWLSTDPYKGLTLSQIGEKIFQGRCTVCHKTTSEKLIGPGLAGIYGKDRQLTNGRTVKADSNYLRESILNPGAKIVKDYTNQMTPFSGILSEEEVSGLIEYMKTLK